MDQVIFLDRDGTINREVEYLHRPEDLELLPGAAEAIRLFREQGYRIVVVTNQAGVARGYYKEEDVEKLHGYLNELLSRQGAGVDHFFYCPHHPDYGIGKYKTDCPCRKPEPGLLLRAGEYYDIDKERSWMIGDKLTDVEAGRRYGVRGILVGTGYGGELRRKIPLGKEADYYDFYAEDLMDAAGKVLGKKLGPGERGDENGTV